MRLYANQPIGTVPRARQLRRDAPEPERRLLRALKQAFPSMKWRHQAPVGPFYVDILCFSEKLVIEVDGDTHADREWRDASRTNVIEDEGFRVLRVSNNDVMQNLDGVIAQISLSVQEREGAHRASDGKGEDSTNGKGRAE
ncbi:endonuclease domain-containing protein [Sphingomonas sp. MMS24-J45]|uniref:endonuclease domain-containing protein n=1 Tax=Sphingomonas sp. MMS24-J45 TaxID=3238806 RepID=UPI0038501997